MKYELRTDIAASTVVYSTPPTVLGSVQINRTYVNTTVPAPVNLDKTPQEIYPPKFGIQHYVTRQRCVAAPAGGSIVQHPFSRLGNTVRAIILVIKQNGSRTSAEANLPTRIQLKLGDTSIIQESSAYRRRLMRQRYGFDAPAGVLVYEWMTDLTSRAGDELGLDYLWTSGLTVLTFEMTWPAGIGSTNNSLDFIVDDLLVPDNKDIYAPDGI